MYGVENAKPILVVKVSTSQGKVNHSQTMRARS
jgi:hypothetical protein